MGTAMPQHAFLDTRHIGMEALRCLAQSMLGAAADHNTSMSQLAALTLGGSGVRPGPLQGPHGFCCPVSDPHGTICGGGGIHACQRYRVHGSNEEKIDDYPWEPSFPQ